MLGSTWMLGRCGRFARTFVLAAAIGAMASCSSGPSPAPGEPSDRATTPPTTGGGTSVVVDSPLPTYSEPLEPPPGFDPDDMVRTVQPSDVEIGGTITVNATCLRGGDIVATFNVRSVDTGVVVGPKMYGMVNLDERLEGDQRIDRYEASLTLDSAYGPGDWLVTVTCPRAIVLESVGFRITETG